MNLRSESVSSLRILAASFDATPQRADAIKELHRRGVPCIDPQSPEGRRLSSMLGGGTSRPCVRHDTADHSGERSRIDAAMGMPTNRSGGVRHERSAVFFGVQTADEAKAAIKASNK